MHEGDEITTIEGVGQPGNLHPMQAAFVEHDGYQCGYCTSGQIMSAVALLKEPIGPSDEDIKNAMAGNICRCGAYTNIVAAVRQARQDGRPEGGERPCRPLTTSRLRASTRRVAGAGTGKFIAGGTTLVDLMKLDVERPTALVDINLLPLEKIEKLPTGGLAHRRDGAQLRPGVERGCKGVVCGAFGGTSLRRVSTVAQHGDHGRKPAAAHAMRVLPRAQRGQRLAATDATSARRAQAARRWMDSTAPMRFWAPATTASRRIHRTCAWPWRRWRR